VRLFEAPDLLAVGWLANRERENRFQISDDLLDVLATPEETGKDTGKDAAKVTFVKLLGVEGARTLAAELLGFAVESLAPLGRKAEPLRELARFVELRGR